MCTVELDLLLLSYAIMPSVLVPVGVDEEKRETETETERKI